jgi:hypothetical protein
VRVQEARDEPVDGRIEPDGDEQPERQVEHLVRDRPEEGYCAGPAIVSGHHVEEHVGRICESHDQAAATKRTESNPAGERQREDATQGGREQTVGRTVVKEAGLSDQDARNEIEIGRVAGNHEGGEHP